MNPLHYPSLELCKKLQEVGFPETTISIVQDFNWKDFICDHYEYNREDFIACCPSVMEMLDVMPWVISTKWDNYFLSVDKFWTCATYETLDRKTLLFCVGGIPNALAEMILWLVENKHLSFK